MASISKDAGGTRRILFVAADGSRKTIRLGKISERVAEQICRHVEALAASLIHGQPVARETAVWVSGIGQSLHDRLVRVGLVVARVDVRATKLGPFIDAYIAERVDVKPQTLINMRRAHVALVEHFGEGKPLSTITGGDADAFRLALLGKGLADNTVRRTCGRARQFFKAAIRSELIQRNPFDGIKCAVGANPKRRRFISRADSQKVLDACPNAEWRLIFALSRFGGLRCPSEHLALRWGDVDWEHNRLIVQSPKTERHEGKASRIMPIFPELLPHLRDAFDRADAGTEFVVAHKRGAGVNWRTQLERIIQRAGLQPWPKLFHNLRATRETELAESFPLHVVCAWIGNSPTIAAKHYLQVTDEHFDRAIRWLPSSEKAVQNPAQQAHARGCKPSHGEIKEIGGFAYDEIIQEVAEGCVSNDTRKAPRVGLEPTT
ncbi:tyrosine-type recombinase/integrase [bacterium]|nr:tyrosine-type recombinase/integrase [bacterium]